MTEMAKSRIDRLLINRDFARLWSGQAVSSVGDFVFDTTLTLWIASELLAGSRWAPSAVSGLMLCALIAVVVVGPVAGVFVDRWDRRKTMLATETIRGALVAGIAGMTFLPADALPTWVWLVVLYVTVLIVNSCGQFFNPARFATIGEVVDGEQAQTKAFGLSQATVSTASVIGPPLAAPLLFSFGIQWALLLNALSYVVSYASIRTMSQTVREIEPPRLQSGLTGWRTEFADGLRLFRTNRYLTSLLGVAVLASLGTGAITPLLIFFLEDNLGSSGSLLGVLTAAFGLGSITGALLAGRMAAIAGARALTWAGLLCGGAVLLAFARQTQFVPAMILMFVLAVPVAALNAGISPQLLATTPAAFRGRMIAVFTPVNTAASMASLVLAGILTSTVLRGVDATVLGLSIGPIDTILTGSAALILAAGVLGFFTLPPAAATETQAQEPRSAPDAQHLAGEACVQRESSS